MSIVQSFLPETGPKPRVLILGSMPGIASLEAVQYYAHPRNAFWPIMASYFNFKNELTYSEKLSIVKHRQVALWDVLASCEREGSLDSAIKNETMVPNLIEDWLKQQSTVTTILCNGGKSAQTFKKHFKTLFSSQDINVVKLPSTSPAHAAMSLAEKKQQWHKALNTVFQTV